MCAVAAVAFWALVADSFDDKTKLLTSALAVALATLGGLTGLTVLASAGHRRRLGQATIAVSGLALALATVLIWVPLAQNSDILDRAFALAFAAMLPCAHASLICGRLRREDTRTVRAVTRIAVGSASSAALLVGAMAAGATSPYATGPWLLIYPLVVIAVLTTLLAPLARLISRPSHARG